MQTVLAKNCNFYNLWQQCARQPKKTEKNSGTLGEKYHGYLNKYVIFKEKWYVPLKIAQKIAGPQGHLTPLLPLGGPDCVCVCACDVGLIISCDLIINRPSSAEPNVFN